MPTTKLHEMLPVEGNLETQAISCRADLANSFEKKPHLFQEKRIVFTPIEEGAKQEVKIESTLTTTVPKELAWISGYMAEAMDASLKVAEANTRAFADIRIDDGSEHGLTLATKVPATALLELEKRLTDWVLHLIKAVPTLDQAKGFVLDPQTGDNVYRAREINKPRTKKENQPIVLYKHTEQHAAQVQLVTVDVPTGSSSEQEWSGLLPTADKSAMMDRAEALIRAVRAARARANDCEVNTKLKLGKALLDYVFTK